MQSCVAISGDGRGWFLINCSPDVRFQIESFEPLWPQADKVRGSAIAGVMLTNADLDHTLGLLHLRESGPIFVIATDAVRTALSQGLRLDEVLSTYGGIRWAEPSMELTALCDLSGSPAGLQYQSFPVPGKPPRYRPDAKPSIGDAVGFRFVDQSTRGSVVIVPDLGGWNDTVAQQAGTCDLLLLDGTFFDNNEMQRAGVGHTTAAQMGHLPIADSLPRIADLTGTQRVYIHINNTNPILLEDSPQRRTVEAAGVLIGFDGMQFDL